MSGCAVDGDRLERAAELLAGMHRGARRLAALPDGLEPRDAADAMAMQAALVRRLDEPVMGWKVGAETDGVLLHGAILRSRIHHSPATIPAATVAPIGVEAEIAFLFDHDAPAREAEYGYHEVQAITTPFVAIEVVSSRFANYLDAPFLDRVADLVSNGAFVRGTERPDLRLADLSDLDATLAIDGKVVVRRRGGHASGDPRLPMVALVNRLRHGPGVREGQFMTTGTCTGLEFAAPGQSVEAGFAGVGAASVRFTG
jgi:2-keto-4-pentenoate hydratase